ncbi:MAG TPA: hypothetical protein VN653_15060, partial [Anaerolineales bacterium]|nr:hypothetical protein [Anaerolineales bacterium]
MKNKNAQLTGGKLAGMLRYPIHPFLFGIYPILYQMAINISEVSFGYIYRPLLVSLTGAVVLLLLFRAVYRDWTKAALASTIVLILFYSYGHVYIALKGITFNGLFIFRHRTLIPLWIVGAALALWQIARRSLTGSTLTSMFN